MADILGYKKCPQFTRDEGRPVEYTKILGTKSQVRIITLLTILYSMYDNLLMFLDIMSCWHPSAHPPSPLQPN